MNIIFNPEKVKRINWCAHIERVNEIRSLGYLWLVFAANDIFISKAIDVVELVKKQPIYRQKVKKITKQLEQAINDYSRRFNNELHNPLAFSYFAQYIEDEVDTSITMLEMTIKNEVDKNRFENSVLISKLCMNMSLVMMTLSINDISKAKYHCVDAPEFRLTGIHNLMAALMDEIAVLCKCDFRLVNGESVLRCVEHLARKLCDNELTDRAIAYTEAELENESEKTVTC